MRKGDFIFSSDHVIEIIAKLFLQLDGTTGTSNKRPHVQFGTKYVQLSWYIVYAYLITCLKNHVSEAYSRVE